MQNLYLKKLVKQDIEKSFAVSTSTIESFWGVSLDSKEYNKITACSASDPNKTMIEAYIHKGNQGKKDWRITGESFKSLLKRADGAKAEENDIIYVSKIKGHFVFSVVSPADNNYALLLSLLGQDNHGFLTHDDKTDTSDITDQGLAECITLLKKNKNLILTGAPGTGKTHLAKRIAAALIGTTDEDILSDEENEQVSFIQFHPSFDYTDFVEGLRPNSDCSFSRQDGVFKAFCKRAISGKSATSKSASYSQSSLTSNSSFQDLIDSIKDDIRLGVISSYSRTGKLHINSNNRIEYQTERTLKTIMESNLELLFDHYVQEGKFDIADVTKLELEGLLQDLTKETRDRITRTIDYTQYKWTLTELLKRKHDIDEGTFLKPTKSENAPSEQESKNYIFIIDEINRGELSKIFGELFYSIEPSYRGPKGKVKTQYNNMVEDGDIFKNGFYVPDNVYIIGTMNDVDRGVEAMDFAIRRRFAWKEVTASESADRMGIKGLTKVKMEALNKALNDEHLSDAYHIGGAYFLKLDSNNDYSKLWENHLKGIVVEYFRGEPDAKQKVERIKKAYTDAKLKIETIDKNERQETV